MEPAARQPDRAHRSNDVPSDPLPPLFRQLVRTRLSSVEPDQRVAAFDADGTLWAEDVGELLFRRLAAKGLLRAPDGAAPLSEEQWWGTYEGMRRDDPKAAFAWCSLAMAGLAEADVQREAKALAHELAAVPSVRRERILGWIRELRDDGWQIWVVSASNWWIVSEAARFLGLNGDRVIGVRLDVIAGVLQPRLHEPFPQAAGKPEALREAGVARVALAVGNTMGDREMLASASHLAVAMEPDEELYMEARLRGWPSVWFTESV